MKTFNYRYLIVCTLAMLLCMQLGLVVWTLVRFTQIEHWSPGIRFFGSEMIQTKGLTKSAVSNLQEGTWFHLVRIRQDEGIVAVQIENGSPADLAGLQPGDRIISVDGIDLRSRPEAYFQARLQSQPGDRLELVWLRGDQIHTGVLTLKATQEVPYALQVDQQEIVMGVAAMTWFQRGPFLIFPIVLLGFGTWMGFRSPHNAVAYRCALLFLATALSSSPAFHPMIAGWPDWVLSLSIFIVVSASFLETVLILQVLSVFPGSTALGSWLRGRAWFILTPVFAWTVCRLIYFLSLTHGWNNEIGQFVVRIVEPVPVPALPLLVVILAGGLLIAQRSVARRQQRMRLQIVEVGFYLALILAPLWMIVQPGTLLASWGLVPAAGPAVPVIVWMLDRIVHVGLECALPLSFAYAILAHRVFGLRFVFGRSLRYLATTPGTYLVLILGMFIVLYETIAIWPIGLDESNLLPAGIAAVLILVLIAGWTWVKTPIVRYMDRHLFSNEYQNRQRLLRLGRQLTHFQDRDILLERTGQELLECLDLSFAAIYLNEGARQTPSASWYGAREVPGQDRTRDASFFTGNPKRVARLLQTTSPERPLMEYGDIQADENLRDLGFELIVTLRSGSDRQGIIALGPKLSEEPFSGDEKERLLVLATEMELVLENLAMGSSLKQQAQRFKLLAHRLIDVQESERLRLARDLHDDTGQALTVLKISLELARKELSGAANGAQERLDDAVSLTDETLEKLRTIARDLRPPTLDTIGLNATLDRFCQSFAHRTGIAVQYEGQESTRQAPTIDICLYRILQEGLANCAKHARASHIGVELTHDEHGIGLSIADDGQGFDPVATLGNQDAVGIGLIDMQERLESLGGRLDIHTRPGTGVRLAASIPWESA